MATRDQLTQVSDGDQLNDGYFNEIGLFYVEATDSSGANITHNTNTLTLKRTFDFTGLSTNYHVVGLELEDITLSDSSANASDSSLLGVKIDDGTNHYAIRKSLHGGFNTDNEDTVAEATWEATDASFSTEYSLMRVQSSTNMKRFSMPIPIGMMTGATSYTVEFWLRATQTSANTATLTKGFKVRLLVCKRPQDLGTTVNQS